MNKSKLIVIAALVVIVGGVFLYLNEHKPPMKIDPVSEYEDLLKQSESPLVIAQDESTVQPTLTVMLESGIYTLSGVVKSVTVTPNKSPERYQLQINNQPTGIKAVSQIELVKAFLINGHQVMLFGFDQGGNQCDREYQFLTVKESEFIVSKPFGSCLALNNLVESGDIITVSTPQNNPYLGDDLNYIYQYKDAQVKLIGKPTKKMLRNKYANFTPQQILNKATADGCYQDGVLLDDGACGGGRKYCTMFKNLRNPTKDSNYQVLKEFCN